MKQAEAFHSIFVGLDRAHGRFQIYKDQGAGKQKIKGNAVTILQPPTVELWELHLKGVQGLGVVPILSDNTCWWGAIDIDVYNLDLIKLEAVISKYKIPAVVCRTKSGGAHLYFFLTEKMPAATLRTKLNELAGIIGFPSVEVFPKQSALANEKDVGNWINMPYFDAEHTLRYAIKKGKTVTAKQFIALVAETRVSPSDLLNLKIDIDEPLIDGPPCLQHFCRVGFPPGSMNHALFSMGVYARMKYTDGWEQKVDEYNQAYMGPGSSKEVQNIIKQLKNKTYFYKCADIPLKDACNKSLCAKRKYGIGGGEAPEMPFVLGTLVKIDSNPPLWFIDVDGHRIELTTEDLLDQRKFRKLCVERIHKLPPLMKGLQWDKIVTDRLDNLEIMAAPQDAGVDGQFLVLLGEFFSRPPADDRDQLLMGRHFVTDADEYLFRSNDLLYFLERKRFKKYGPRELWAVLRNHGATHGQMNIKGQCVQYWSIKDVNVQHEEFSLPNLAGEKLPY